MSASSAQDQPNSGKSHDVAKKAIAAIAVLAFAAATLVLPPIANLQFAHAVSTLRQPVVDAVVGVAFLAVSVMWLRATVVIAVVIGLVAVGQLSYFAVTTSDGRSALETPLDWTTTSTAAPDDAPTGNDGVPCLHNDPDKYGKASECWQPDGSIDIDLDDTVGTSQQGVYYPAGPTTGKYLLTAKVDKLSGTPDTACPLFIGVRSIYDYYIFYLKEIEPGKYIAELDHRTPRPAGKEGFIAHEFAKSDPLPYVKYWNLARSWEGTSYRLTVRADGDHYNFFVNDRKQFDTHKEGRLLPDSPPHQTTIGIVAITMGVNDTLCSFSDVKVSHS